MLQRNWVSRLLVAAASLLLLVAFSSGQSGQQAAAASQPVSTTAYAAYMESLQGLSREIGNDRWMIAQELPSTVVPSTLDTAATIDFSNASAIVNDREADCIDLVTLYDHVVQPLATTADGRQELKEAQLPTSYGDSVCSGGSSVGFTPGNWQWYHEKG